METHTKSHLLRQLGGAGLGILVATIIYFAMSWSSFSNIQGYLVNGLNTANPDRVRVSDKTIDDRTLARITERAKEVAAAINETDATHAAASESSSSASRRSGSRQILTGNGFKPYTPVQAPPPPIEVPVYREVIKEVPVPGPVQTVIKEVPVPGPTKTIIKEVRVPTPAPAQVGKNLPDSGPGLWFLAFASLAAAVLWLRPDKAFRLQ